MVALRERSGLTLVRTERQRQATRPAGRHALFASAGFVALPSLSWLFSAVLEGVMQGGAQPFRVATGAGNSIESDSGA